MTIRNLLIPLVGAKLSDQRTLETGLRVAQLFDGHLDALFVRPDALRQLPLAEEGTQTLQELERIKDEIGRREKSARSQFDKFRKDNQIKLCEKPPAPEAPSASWQLATGVEAQEVARRGGAYDLIVIDSALPRSRHASRETLEALLFSTGRPVLLAPPAQPKKLGETILLGWNRTAQSARAVLGSMPFLRRANRVIVLMVATGAKEGPSPQDIARTLAWHDIETEVREITPDDRSVGRVLLDEAKGVDADLLVMGAYSHNRWREMILGGVTKYVIEHAELPVILAH